MRGFQKFRAATQRAVSTMIAALFLLMFGITNLNVFTRYFLNKPITFAVEMGRYCFVSIIFLGAIITTREDRHIQVDFLIGLMPPKLRFFMGQLGRLLLSLFFGMLSFQTLRMTLANIAVKSSAMQIPMAIPYGVMLVGCVGICFESLLNFVAPHVEKWGKWRDEKEEERGS